MSVSTLCVPFALQRMSELLPSTAPAQTKMAEAAALCHDVAEKLLEKDSESKANRKM